MSCVEVLVGVGDEAMDEVVMKDVLEGELKSGILGQS